jgi:hypothetical protein
MGFAVSLSLLVAGTVLVIAVHSPKTGPNLQTAGLVLMLIALTALSVVMTLRDEPGRPNDGDERL